MIATTPSYLNIFLTPLFSRWLGLLIIIAIAITITIFIILTLFSNNTFSFCSVQEHLVTPNCIMTSHPSCHLHRKVSFVACSKGYLCKIDMKTLWRLRVVAIKCPM